MLHDAVPRRFSTLLWREQAGRRSSTLIAVGLAADPETGEWPGPMLEPLTWLCRATNQVEPVRSNTHALGVTPFKRLSTYAENRQMRDLIAGTVWVASATTRATMLIHG